MTRHDVHGHQGLNSATMLQHPALPKLQQRQLAQSGARVAKQQRQQAVLPLPPGMLR